MIRVDSDRVAHLAGLVIAAFAALAALPSTLFAPGWFVVMTVPAALLVASLHLKPSRWFGTRTRVLLAALLQVEGLKLGLDHLGGLQREAALTLVLVPALTWMVLRHRGSDGILAIFLSLCILLIAAMLPASEVVVPGLVWFVASTLAFATDTSLLVGQMRHAVVGATGGRWLLWRARVFALVALALVVPGLLALFGLLPGTLGPAKQPHSEAQGQQVTRPQVGLSSRFELGGQPGVPLELLGEEILVVTPFGKVDEKVPDNLYLRSTYFDRADVDRWTTSPPQPRTIHCDHERAAIADPHPGIPRSTLAIQRLDASSGIVPVPPGLYEIGGIRDLAADTLRGFYREKNPKGELDYLVGFQDLTALADRAKVEIADARRHTYLPDRLRSERMNRLWRELGGDTRWSSASELAQRLSSALQTRCSYALEEPRGRETTSSLERFLFESRKGYCMHFATALAIFLRMSGVPCRIAVGLQGGRIDPEDRTARRFGQKHAHAWVEIPFEDLGWVVFDPTPAASLPNSNPGNPGTGETTKHPSAEQADFGAVLDRLWASASARNTVLVAGLLVACALLTLCGRRFRAAVRNAVGSRTSLSRARQLLAAILREVAERGHPRPAGWTLEAWVRELEGRPGIDHPRLQLAVSAYQEVRFGGRELDERRLAALAGPFTNPEAR